MSCLKRHFSAKSYQVSASNHGVRKNWDSRGWTGLIPVQKIRCLKHWPPWPRDASVFPVIALSLSWIVLGLRFGLGWSLFPCKVSNHLSFVSRQERHTDSIVLVLRLCRRSKGQIVCVSWYFRSLFEQGDVFSFGEW